MKTIYRLFLNGKTPNAIAACLTEQGIPTPHMKKIWQATTVESILTNEKYKGDAILQKSFTVDFLNKKMKVNEGEVTQYYVKDSHPAIIDKEEWDKVQQEMAERKARGRHGNSGSTFAGKIVCGDCGEYFGSKVWHSTDKYRRVIWRCNGKYAGEHKCATPHLSEETIKKHFLSAVGKLMTDRDELLDNCDTMRETLLIEIGSVDREREKSTEEMDAVSALAEKLIAENASAAMERKEYNRRYDGLSERFDRAQKRSEALNRRKGTLLFEIDMIECFMTEIRLMPELPIDFEELHWHKLIDHVTVHSDDRLVFTFKTGIEITETL